jgi:hypothetical protein
MLRALKVATPAVAVTVVVPESVPPAGLNPRATVTVPPKLGTVFPSASRALTCTAGVIVAPASVGVGCTVNATCVAGPAVMSNGALAAQLSPLVDAVSV